MKTEHVYVVAGVALALAAYWWFTKKHHTALLSSGKLYVVDAAYDQAGY